jgi:hypothetical protein
MKTIMCIPKRTRMIIFLVARDRFINVKTKL